MFILNIYILLYIYIFYYIYFICIIIHILQCNIVMIFIDLILIDLDRSFLHLKDPIQS